ncbi:hypothetical protein FRC09_017051 [Ceratobasidium sp. 395]|nr:hypothetical protein FRC09_017051 [Ceratobasidium sp. 395]
MTQTVPLAHLASTKPTAAESSSRKTLNSIALAVAKAKRIVVVTGAGISCSSGIPDFRSSDGLYNLVKSRYPDAVLKGRDLFDSALFRDPTSSAVFYTFMAELKTQIDSARPAPVHDFLATLDAKGKLLRSYTQNIDGLEERAGLRTGTGDVNPAGGGGTTGAPRPKNVQLHGDIHRVRCTLCSASFACTSEHIDQFRTGTPPDCPECTARSDARTARAARALKCGTLRPAIVLYDEPHPLGDHIGAVQTSDLGKKPDLLIVMGTSLKVHGLRRLVKSFAKAVHSSRPLPNNNNNNNNPSHSHCVLFVNRTAPPPGEWTGVIDYHVEGDADTWVAQVLGEWKKSRPADWEAQTTLDEVNIGRVVKGLGAPGKPKVGNGGKNGKLVSNVKSSKGKSKAGVENTPPEDERPPSSQQTRCVIVLPRSGTHHFKAGTIKSPLKTHTSSTKLKLVGRPSPCQLGMSSPRRLGGTSLKRPAPSPLAPRQTRLDGVFRQSPASRARISEEASGASRVGVSNLSSGTTLLSSSVPGSSTADSSLPSSDPSSRSSSSSPSALSSQVELPQGGAASSAPSSQASSSHDSIFSSQGTIGSSQTSSALSSQTHLPSSSTTSFSFQQLPSSSSSQQLPPSSFSQQQEPNCRQLVDRYLGQPRSPPFRRRFQTVPGPDWSGVGLGVGRPFVQPKRAVTLPVSPRAVGREGGGIGGGGVGSGSGIGGSGGGGGFRDEVVEGLSAFSSQVSLAPPPGPSGSFLGSSESQSQLGSSQSLAPLSPSQSLLAPTKRYVNAIKSPGDVPRSSYWDEGNPRKKGRLSEERDDTDNTTGESKDDTEDESCDVARGLLFSKGRMKDKEVEADVIDLVSDDDDDEDSMSLDGAVGHMSLDCSHAEVDTDMDVEPEPEPEPQPQLQTAPGPVFMRPPISPVQTRARKRAKEKEVAAVMKRGTKKAPKPRVVGTRTSMRLAAQAM